MLAESQTHFPGLDVIYRGDDIRKPTDWRIQDEKHSIVVHLGGRMDRLETELDGFGGSTGAALPGEIWTVPAERKYASHACGKSIEYAVLRLRPDARDIVHDASTGRLDINPVAGMRDEFLHHAVRQLLSAIRTGDDVSAMLAESLSQSISLHVLHAFALGGPIAGVGKYSGPELNERMTRQLRNHIDDRLDERITLEELAKLAGLTKHQFLIAFRRGFGCTPVQYVIRQRLRHAQRLLISTRKDITTIALESGFSSHSHLTACFTEHFGCSPSSFRMAAKPFQIPVDRR